MTLYFAEYHIYWNNLDRLQTSFDHQFFQNPKDSEKYLVKQFLDNFPSMIKHFEKDLANNEKTIFFQMGDKCLSQEIGCYCFKISKISFQMGDFDPTVQIYKDLLIEELTRKAIYQSVLSKSKSSLVSDLLNFYQKEEFTDFEIRGKKVHKLILERRTKMKAKDIANLLNEKDKIQKQTITDQDLESFLDWVYFKGSPKAPFWANGDEKKEKYLNSLQNVFKRLNYDFDLEKEKENIEMTHYEKGFQQKQVSKFFFELMNDQETKDFGIRIQEKLHSKEKKKKKKKQENKKESEKKKEQKKEQKKEKERRKNKQNKNKEENHSIGVPYPNVFWKQHEARIKLLHSRKKYKKNEKVVNIFWSEHQEQVKTVTKTKNEKIVKKKTKVKQEKKKKEKKKLGKKEKRERKKEENKEEKKKESEKKKERKKERKKEKKKKKKKEKKKEEKKEEKINKEKKKKKERKRKRKNEKNTGEKREERKKEKEKEREQKREKEGKKGKGRRKGKEKKEEKIKRVHLLMLLIRSGVYRDLKRSINDLSEIITDFSLRSEEFWDFFLHWIYTGKIKNQFWSNQIKNELTGSQEYFQLSEESYFKIFDI
ncbi:DNAj [Anaeramoeba flamelloides]|uniref:DNAj n=1 Tax=Anaeramoeba flamelloides TaxID=1746091 RepID=A0ABQ8Y2P6_9EUKA|nr:DNAj [Anaeramoeba flamelloides]